MDTYPETFAFVQIHHGDAFATSWGNTRANFYTDFGSYPTTYFDGMIQIVGAQPYTTFENNYLNRQGTPTDVSIALGAVQDTGSTFTVNANVCIDADGVGKTMRIYIVQVLDHWPTVVSYSRNGFKQAARH